MKKLIFVLVLFIFVSLGADDFIQLGVINPLQITPESTPVKGLKLNLVHSSTNDFEGLDIGIVSQVNSSFKGIQFNWVNFNQGTTTGLQIAEVFSSTKDMKGVQLSPVNYTAGSMTGLQVGLLNIIKGDGKNFQLGFINYNEYGFLKIFPFVNFNL